MSKEDLTILLIGGGAREHTISCAYENSLNVKKIIVAPGNDFIAYKRKKEVLVDKDCSLKDPLTFLEIARKYQPDLVDVVQDDALAVGVVDMFEKEGYVVFGPKKDTARIEWDKRWSREFMQMYGIPHPQFKYFDNETDAGEYVNELYKTDSSKLLYVKATGLCSGKGALKSTNIDEALENILRMKQFPNGAGNEFLVEEGLEGEEFSYYAISDGQTYKLFKSAQDNKTIYNFDEGDQTGGMGAVSPALVTVPISSEIEKQQISKMMSGMVLENKPYKGILYLGGILLDEKHGKKLMNIEYNARWGDPECQVVLSSVISDYCDIVMSCIDGKLKEFDILQDNKTRVCVVGASKGYPNDYSNVKGKMIYGIDEVMKMDGINVYGAGIDVIDRKLYVNGGRLLSIVAEGEDILEAREKAYSAIARVSIEGNNLHYRTDIGWRDVERLRNLL